MIEAMWHRRRWTLWLGGAVGLALATACGGEGEAGHGDVYVPVSDVQGGGLIDSGAGGDASGDVDHDVGSDAVDSGAAEDVAADTGQPGDGGPVDGDGGDATGDDTSVADSITADSGGADVAGDTSQDAGGSDANSACSTKLASFEAIAAKARACASPYDCWGPAAAVEGKGWTFGGSVKPGCACPTYWNGNAPETAGVADLASEYKKAGCPDSCPNVDCDTLDKKVGVCEAGQCMVKSLSCKEIEALVEGAITEGRQCKADSECSAFGMQGGLPCGCGVNVNLAKMAPGKPIFLYVTMMTQAYVAMGCNKDIQCDCAPIGKGVCKAGLCQSGG